MPPCSNALRIFTAISTFLVHPNSRTASSPYRQNLYLFWACCPWIAGMILPQTGKARSACKCKFLHLIQSNDNEYRSINTPAPLRLHKNIKGDVHCCVLSWGNWGNITLHQHCLPSLISCPTLLVFYWFSLITLFNHFHMSTCLRYLKVIEDIIQAFYFNRIC